VGRRRRVWERITVFSENVLTLLYTFYEQYSWMVSWPNRLPRRLSDPNDVNTFRGPSPTDVSSVPATPLPKPAVSALVWAAPRGSVLAFGGIGSECLRRIVDQVEAERDSPRALFARISPAPTTEAIIEQVIDLLSRTAHRLWPIWFTDVNFMECRSDTLGRLAAAAIIRRAAEKIVGLRDLRGGRDGLRFRDLPGPVASVRRASPLRNGRKDQGRTCPAPNRAGGADRVDRDDNEPASSPVFIIGCTYRDCHSRRSMISARPMPTLADGALVLPSRRNIFLRQKFRRVLFNGPNAFGQHRVAGVD
jgi:hypothetical protein